MMKLEGNILTPQGFIRGAISFGDDGKIESIQGEPLAENTVRDLNEPIILPGFVDLHVHGGGGRDIMEGGDAAARIMALHGEHGTTAMLATTMTAPPVDLENAFTGLSSFFKADNAHKNKRGARLLGVHLEGPYINPGKLGAQPDFTRPMQANELKKLNALAPIRLITLAPEVPGNMGVIESLCQAGYKIQIGHSLGTYEEGVAALKRGATGFTHLFNAMTGLHHRKPGMVGAALAHAEFAEIIPDLLHVHPGAIRVALRAIPKLFCVTDSTAATGMPDGEYRLGRHTVTKCLGGVRLADGTLAGSTLSLDQALRNLVDELKLDLVDASRRVSTNACDFLGITDRGRLEKGAWADVVMMDRDLMLQSVFSEGVKIG
jgi:N-acetylglucosamine-6-phosphate deacetylase